MKYKVDDSFNPCCEKVNKFLLQFSHKDMIYTLDVGVLRTNYLIFGEKVVTIYQSNPYGECEIKFEDDYIPQEYIDEWLKDTYGFYEVLCD